MTQHADAVLATMAQGDATSLIATSWRRCATAHRLDPDSLRIPERDPIALREAEERDATLLAIAGSHLDQLFAAIGDPNGNTSLCDRNGLAIAMRVGTSQDVHERRPWRWLGVAATEAVFGTNGNGTCLVEERPVVVSGEHHFFSSLIGMTCFAAPIFGPDGCLVACLNATATKPRGQAIETFAQMAVRSAARRIEVELFAAAFPGTRLVLASGAARDPGALLSVDRDGVVVGATRGARRLLALKAEDLARGIDLDTLRGSGASERLVDTERKLLARALARHDGNVTRAAKALGISRSTFYRKAAPPARNERRRPMRLSSRAPDDKTVEID